MNMVKRRFGNSRAAMRAAGITPPEVLIGSTGHLTGLSRSSLPSSKWTKRYGEPPTQTD
jgi:hypothetical protein